MVRPGQHFTSQQPGLKQCASHGHGESKEMKRGSLGGHPMESLPGHQNHSHLVGPALHPSWVKAEKAKSPAGQRGLSPLVWPEMLVLLQEMAFPGYCEGAALCLFSFLMVKIVFLKGVLETVSEVAGRFSRSF